MEKKNWNEFIIKNNGSFLQSWQWGEIQKANKSKIFRIKLNEKAQCQIIKKYLAFNKAYFYCPAGPVVKNKETKPLFDKITELAQNEKVIFLRFEPRFDLVKDARIEKTIDIQPSKTVILNLNKSQDELLAQMHQKTRYNIRLAQKKGVVIKQAEARNKEDYFEEFWNLLQATSKRDGFRTHKKNYYKNLLSIDGQNLNDELTIKLFVAKYKSKIIAAIMIVFFNQTATYIHGASDYNYRYLMAPYLLQWHCINTAKKLKYKYYDFYGVDEKKWKGLTRFKKGFSQTEVQFPGTFDLVFDKKWYKIYKLVRGLKRGLNV